MHINTLQEVFRPVLTPVKGNNLVSFGHSQDIFVRSHEAELSLEQQIDKCYDNIEKQLGIVNGKDIALMAERLSRKLPEISKNDIYYTMGVLSQYSSYKSWAHFENEFEKHDVGGIAVNPLIKPNSTKGLPVCLTDVMSYLAEKNCVKFLPKKVRPNEALVLDSKLLKQMEQNPQLLRDIEDEGFKLLYIENFEEGYNFLNQGDDFEDFVFNVLGKCDGRDVKSELHEILNGSNIERIKKLGLESIVISKDVSTHPSSIADNLNPIIPSKEDFCVSLERTTGENLQDGLKILNAGSIFVSPRKFSENIKILYEKITKKLKDENIEEVFYAIPDIEKSFSIVNYIYQKVNNIPDDHFINHNLKIKKSKINEEMSSYPDKFAVVVLDDVSATGSSLVTGPFYYVDMQMIREISGKDIRTVIAPMYSTHMAKNFIKSVFDKIPNNTSDYFVTAKLLPEYSKEMTQGIEDNPMMFYMGNDCLTSIIFPYMGPDTNDPRFFRIYERMLYTSRAQKEL